MTLPESYLLPSLFVSLLLPHSLLGSVTDIPSLCLIYPWKLPIPNPCVTPGAV